MENPYEQQQSVLLSRIIVNVVRPPLLCTAYNFSCTAQEKLNEAIVELTTSLNLCYALPDVINTSDKAGRPSIPTICKRKQ